MENTKALEKNLMKNKKKEEEEETIKIEEGAFVHYTKEEYNAAAKAVSMIAKLQRRIFVWNCIRKFLKNCKT